MAQWLRRFASSREPKAPSIHVRQLTTTCKSRSERSDSLFRPPQVLSHMGLQNLKAEVDPSLEPGSDQRTSENPQGCSRLRTHGGLHATVLRHQIMHSSYRQQLGPSSRVILVQLSEKHQRICQRLHGQVFRVQLLSSFSYSTGQERLYPKT